MDIEGKTNKLALKQTDQDDKLGYNWLRKCNRS
jgi:hypothetical protein